MFEWASRFSAYATLNTLEEPGNPPSQRGRETGIAPESLFSDRSMSWSNYGFRPTRLVRVAASTSEPWFLSLSSSVLVLASSPPV